MSENFADHEDPLLDALNEALAEEGEWHKGANQIPGTKHDNRYGGDPFYLAPVAFKYAKKAALLGKSAVVETIMDRVSQWPGVDIRPEIHNVNAQLLARAGKLKPALEIVLGQITRTEIQESDIENANYIEAFDTALGIKDLASLRLADARSTVKRNASKAAKSRKELLGLIESRIQKLNSLKINDELPHDQDHKIESKNILAATIVSAWEHLYYAGEHGLAILLENIDTTASKAINLLRVKIDSKK